VRIDECWICRTRKSDARSENGAPPFLVSCRQCALVTQPHAVAWQTLSRYLQAEWRWVTARSAFDLSKAFSSPGSAAIAVHLFFVKVLGSKLSNDRIDCDLRSFSAALLGGLAHPEVTLRIANVHIPAGRLQSYDSELSLLQTGAEVLSATWTYLAHPIAVKICYIKAGAPVQAPPDAHPWHPTRQRKLVKLSPYKGDTQSTFARRDLRI
jgi:hypothetical protein